MYKVGDIGTSPCLLTVLHDHYLQDCGGFGELAQCWFLGLAISKLRKQFYQTALGNCYGLKLPNADCMGKIDLLCHLL